MLLLGEVAWTGMAAALLPDPLWDLVEPFLPIPPRRPKGGRLRVSDRACLTGIVFVLRRVLPHRTIDLPIPQIAALGLIGRLLVSY